MITGGGKRIFIQEVAPRDGFQIEPRFIATDDKVRLIDGLSQTGLAKIEVTSFSSPRAIPALADADLVLKRIRRVPGVEYAALVPTCAAVPARSKWSWTRSMWSSPPARPTIGPISV